MGHPKYKKDITKEELEGKLYVSRVDEFRRHVRYHKKIKINDKNKNILFDNLIIALKKLYTAPNKDFSKVETKLMIKKTSYKIALFNRGKNFQIESISKGHLYTVNYTIKKTFGKYYVHYYDSVITQKTVYGMTGNLAKYYYKKACRKNSRLIKIELKIMKQEKR